MNSPGRVLDRQPR
uniref:Uncharacterized protein n=1 Tax=Anguilla anguilla TaxID=7936 RepID=A0A0E9PZH3_ANGAN